MKMFPNPNTSHDPNKFVCTKLILLTYRKLRRIHFFWQAPKAPRPQSFNYAPEVVEKRRPVQQAPAQYYDYEEEQQTTPRPIQIARPKYAVPQQRPQHFGSDAGVVYAPQRPTAQYQTFENREPVQFPAENASPAPSRAENQFTLFSPAARADNFRTKVRRRKTYIRPVRRYRLSRWRRKRNKNKVLIILKKKKRYYS